MVATIPINRLGAHFDTVPAGLPELPQSARERGQLWSDAVFQALLALQKQLTHRDAAVVAAAANSILELERTRIRHGRSVAGSELVSSAQLEYEAEQSRKFDYFQKPTEQTEARSNEQALAEHIEELREENNDSGEPMTGSPAGYVVWQLDKWGVSANAIPKGGFIDYLLGHGIGVEATKVPECVAAR